MGQAKKNKRECPAVGRVITASECGENRASRYACPASCPHNPWAPGNYDRALDIEDGLNKKMLQRLIHEDPHPPGLDDALAGSPWQSHNFYLTKYQSERDAAGRTFYERWQPELGRELNNDERFFLTHKMQSRLGLVEVHRILPTGQSEVVDLLTPAGGTLLVQDNNLAKMAVRFTQLLVWYYPMPHYYRMNGTALAIPDVSGLDGMAIWQEIVGHCGGATEPAAARAWSAKNYARLEAAFNAVAAARREQGLKSIDARFSKATYRLRGTAAELLRRLATLPALEDEPPAPAEIKEEFHTGRVWFAEPAAGRAQIAGRPVLGRVLVADDRVRIEAGTDERYQALRTQFEKLAGRLVEFTGERVDDLAAQLRAKQPAIYDATLVPPRLLENPEQFRLTSSRIAPTDATLPETAAQMVQAHLKEFLTTPVPLLDNRTPRQAAAEPAWRPQLLVLLKRFVRGHDERNLADGRTDDINWLLRELGASELLFDPPPVRAPQSVAPGTPPDDFSAPPALPNRPWTEDEVFDRLEQVGLAFPAPEEMMDAFEEEAAEVCDLINLVTENESDVVYDCFILIAGQIWYIFFPPNTGAYMPDLERLRERWLETPAMFQKASQQAGDFAAFESTLAGKRQPNLVKILAGQLLEACAKKEMRKEMSTSMVTLALSFLRALTDELDETMREVA